MEKQGKVWLVGAGPGDPGLFTLRGRQVLDRAQVVVYDALVGQGVLSMIPEGAELIDVGKRAGRHTMPQEEMNRVLLRKAQEGKRVVRLKGGDPFLFGRGGEELELLEQNGIPFEIVPGVTSAIAVPAYNGIPVTHRDFAQSVHIVTGHRREGLAYDIDFQALTRAGGTMVFLMGLSSLPAIVSGLLAAGADPHTPAAVLQQGTCAAQRRVVAPLEDLEAEAERCGIGTPAIIVVGEVCRLADRFAWYEKRPLAGRRILVTRPRELVSGMADLLREQGAEVLEFPAIRTRPISPDLKLRESLEEIKTKGAWDWLVFTSPTGVRIFFDQLKAICDIRAFGSTKIAAIGRGTAKALEEKGLMADLIPAVYDGAHLGQELAKMLREGDRVLIPRAAQGSPELVRELEKVPLVTVRDVATYETLCEENPLIDERAAFEQGTIDFAVFTSASTVRGFAGATRGLDYSLVRAVCIGEATRAAADELGMRTWVAKRATMEAVVDKVIEVSGQLPEHES